MADLGGFWAAICASLAFSLIWELISFYFRIRFSFLKWYAKSVYFSLNGDILFWIIALALESWKKGSTPLLWKKFTEFIHGSISIALIIYDWWTCLFSMKIGVIVPASFIEQLGSASIVIFARISFWSTEPTAFWISPTFEWPTTSMISVGDDDLKKIEFSESNRLEKKFF